MTTPIQCGFLKYSFDVTPNSNPEWKEYYFVLYPNTEVSNGRLDWYKSKEDYQATPAFRKTIFIEEIQSISTENGKNWFEIRILRKEKPLLLSASSQKDVKRWADSLKRLTQECKQTTATQAPKGGENNLGFGIYFNELWNYEEEPEEFPVVVGETESARVCKIDGKEMILQIYSHCFSVKDSKMAEIKYVWPYKYVRRYGCSGKSFTFEAGRNSATGQGVFILMTQEPKTIFDKIHRMAQENTSQPELPPRGYKDNRKHKQLDKQHMAPSDLQKKMQKPPLPDKSEIAAQLAPKPKGKPPIMKPKPMAKVPLADNYSEPATLQYANMTDGHQNPVTSKDQSSNHYAEPEVSSPNSMAVIAAKIRCQQEDSEDEGQYGMVNLSGLDVSSNQNEDNNYGQLYCSGKQRIKVTTKDKY